MDRFEYIDARLFDGEEYLKRDKNVKIYDGDDKVFCSWNCNLYKTLLN